MVGAVSPGGSGWCRSRAPGHGVDPWAGSAGSRNTWGRATEPEVRYVQREGKCLAYLDRHEIADVLEATKGRLGNTVDIDELRIVEGIAADLWWSGWNEVAIRSQHATGVAPRKRGTLGRVELGPTQVPDRLL